MSSRSVVSSLQVQMGRHVRAVGHNVLTTICLLPLPLFSTHRPAHAEFPAVVYEAIRAEGADSRLAKRYRQWCRNVWVPSILRMQKIWHEHGSYLQPLPLEDVDQCYKSFLKVVRTTTLGKSLPRAMMYILLDLYADAWRDLLLVWESNDFSRLYPTIGYPYGILIYSIKMHAMLAKRQKDVNGASFLSTNPHTKLEPSPYNASASGEKDAANDDAADVSLP